MLKTQQEEEENPHEHFDNFSPLPQQFSQASQNLPSTDARRPAVREYYRTTMGLETALPGENTLQQSVGLADKGEY